MISFLDKKKFGGGMVRTYYRGASKLAIHTDKSGKKWIQATKIFPNGAKIEEFLYAHNQSRGQFVLAGRYCDTKVPITYAARREAKFPRNCIVSFT